MCGEMAESFKKQGLALPPWRRTQSMLRWDICRVNAGDTTALGVGALVLKAGVLG